MLRPTLETIDTPLPLAIMVDQMIIMTIATETGTEETTETTTVVLQIAFHGTGWALDQ